MWGLSKPADQTGSVIKHPPIAAAEVSDGKKRPISQHAPPSVDLGGAASPQMTSQEVQ